MSHKFTYHTYLNFSHIPNVFFAVLGLTFLLSVIYRWKARNGLLKVTKIQYGARKRKEV